MDEGRIGWPLNRAINVILKSGCDANFILIFINYFEHSKLSQAHAQVRLGLLAITTWKW